MYRLLSKFYPQNIRERYIKLLTYAHLKINPNVFIGFVLFFGFGIALAASFYLATLFKVPLILTFLGIFFVLEASVYMYVLMQVDAKARFVENILPDVLQLMSSNLRAGLTTDRALLLSSRPEFGPFQEEINLVGKEIAMGKSVKDAFLTIPKRILSDKLSKTIMLITSGIESGGELASLLEQTAENLRKQKFVEEKIKSSIMMYIIFIFAAIGVGAPVLFGLSSFLVEVLTKNLASIDVGSSTVTSSMPLSFSKVSISSSFIMKYAITSLISSSVLGSFTLGLIGKGKETRGVRYIPMLLAVSLTIFFLARMMIRGMIGGLFGL
jgi:pilus assembly protein TadC